VGRFVGLSLSVLSSFWCCYRLYPSGWAVFPLSLQPFGCSLCRLPPAISFSLCFLLFTPLHSQPLRVFLPTCSSASRSRHELYPAQFWRFYVLFASVPLRVIRHGIIDGMSIANAHFNINRRDICCCWCCCLCLLLLVTPCAAQLLRGSHLRDEVSANAPSLSWVHSCTPQRVLSAAAPIFG
jgi:hypothetical protein